jgi:hypothetical protein
MEEHPRNWQENIPNPPHKLHFGKKACYEHYKGRSRVRRICCKLMKHSRPYKSYPTWRQREMRFLILSLIIGLVAAAIAGGVIYLASGRSSSF